MGDLMNTTERGSRHEVDAMGELAALWDKSELSLEERLVSLGLFMRRQELSYLLANYELFKKIAHVKGSIFYFGVYHGARFMTLANMSAALEPYNHTGELIGFDTFADIPRSATSTGVMDASTARSSKAALPAILVSSSNISSSCTTTIDPSTTSPRSSSSRGMFDSRFRST